MSITKRKIILDTDNGDDIDDLFTVYCLLNDNAFDILGIVCSYLNTPLRVRQIKHVLKLKGREDIPVYTGVGQAMKGLHDRPLDTIYWQDSPILHKDEYKPEDEGYDGNKAINFMIDSARRYGKDLTILEVAPELTLGHAIMKDKEAFKDTHIRIMGGSFGADKSEWNIECDVEAARAVFESGCDLAYVGINITHYTTLTNEFESQLFAGKYDAYTQYLVDTCQLWETFSKRNMMMHDPLTYLTLVDDEVVKFKEGEFALLEGVNGLKTYFAEKGDDRFPPQSKYIKIKYGYEFDRQKMLSLLVDKLKLGNIKF